MAEVFGINLGQRILIYLMSQFKPNHTGWRFDRQSALNFSIGFELTSLKKNFSWITSNIYTCTGIRMIWSISFPSYLNCFSYTGFISIKYKYHKFNKYLNFFIEKLNYSAYVLACFLTLDSAHWWPSSENCHFKWFFFFQSSSKNHGL